MKQQDVCVNLLSKTFLFFLGSNIDHWCQWKIYHYLRDQAGASILCIFQVNVVFFILFLFVFLFYFYQNRKDVPKDWFSV